MKINNNELLINIDLTSDVYEQVKLALCNLDDIKLTIKGSRIFLDKFEIPDSVSSLKLEDCSFEEKTKISNLNNGRSFAIKNCRKNFLTGNVKLQNINCTEFSIEEDKNQDEYGELSPFIEECTISYLYINMGTPPVFNRVHFVNKLNINPKGIVDHHQLFFIECRFQYNTEILINTPSPLSLIVEDCHSVGKSDGYDISFLNFINTSIIKSLKITNSKIRNFMISLLTIELREVVIENSEVGYLELSTIDDESNTKNTIYNVKITDSFINRMTLKNREIIHEIDFSNTYFYTPPIIHGSNIPEGSLIPGRKHFISKDGINDASHYRALRLMMESQRNRDLEGMFFSLEQESLLNSKTKTKKYFSVSYLYYILSDYGTNYRTPIFIFLTSIPLFTIIYSLVNSTVLSIHLPIDWNLIMQSFTMTLKQTFLPFDLLRNNNIICNDNPVVHIALILISVINSIFSISLLALSGLALRWKFKRG